MLALKFWPETIMPNKFLGILYDLSLKFYSEGTVKGIAFMKELASDVSSYAVKVAQQFFVPHLAINLEPNLVYALISQVERAKFRPFWPSTGGVSLGLKR